jgi:hypothetical protein
MRNGQNKRMRGRNRKSHNPLTRVYESNGPDVKIRGTASHIAEKYMQLARDAQASGDPVAAENYFQHAEHYFRVIAAAQEQFRPNQPFLRGEGGAADTRDDLYDEGEEDVGAPAVGGGDQQPAFGTRDPQPVLPRDAQFYPQREPFQGRQQQPAGPSGNGQDDDVDRLPSFVTGGPPQPQQGQNYNPNGGYEGQGQGDRFPLHRRRRRHRGPRSDVSPGGPSGDDGPPSGPGPNSSSD